MHMHKRVHKKKIPNNPRKSFVHDNPPPIVARTYMDTISEQISVLAKNMNRKRYNAGKFQYLTRK